MERPENNKWLDEALTEIIGSEKPGTDFEQWKQQHPDAIKMLTSQAHAYPVSKRPLRIKNIIMKNPTIKFATAAVIALAAIAGIYQLTDTQTSAPSAPRLVSGPQAVKLADGSSVSLAEGAKIRINDTTETRGFEHITGIVEVSVVKGSGEFIVTTACGNVKALGTEFTLDMVDQVTADTQERVQLLVVEVKEGSVEVSNSKGVSVLKASRKLIVEPAQKPYDFYQDESLPLRLRERINAAIEAMEAGDPKAYITNYNVEYMFKLIKGQNKYDSNLFGGSEADLERLRQGLADIQSPEDMIDRFLAMGGIQAQGKLYIRSVELNETGDHAQASCIERKGPNRTTITSPEWHYFDNDWWQVDD